MQYKIRTTLTGTIVALGCSIGTANTATFSVEPFPASTSKLIVLSGEINENDAPKFIEATKGVVAGVVILNSPGGSVLDGLTIGRFIRQRGYVTAVPDQTLCASSCALIWLAGSQRFAEESSLIGFHAAYIYKMGKPVETGVGNALIGSYLHELGLSDNAIIYITSAPPEGVEILTESKGAAVGISYRSVKFGPQPSKVSAILPPQRRETAGIEEVAYNPIAAASKFYAALSIADGNAASALVVPEKRGIGPFNEKNIAHFFGNMREPLKVSSMQPKDSDTVEVHYTYRVTKTQCNATAIVETEYFFGNTLIKAIKANC